MYAEEVELDLWLKDKKESVSRCSVGQKGSDLVFKGVKEGLLEELMIEICFAGLMEAYLGTVGKGKTVGAHFRQSTIIVHRGHNTK